VSNKETTVAIMERREEAARNCRSKASITLAQARSRPLPQSKKQQNGENPPRIRLFVERTERK
jgi:hypothetical protein